MRRKRDVVIFDLLIIIHHSFTIKAKSLSLGNTPIEQNGKLHKNGIYSEQKAQSKISSTQAHKHTAHSTRNENKNEKSYKLSIA